MGSSSILLVVFLVLSSVSTLAGKSNFQKMVEFTRGLCAALAIDCPDDGRSVGTKMQLKKI